MVSGKKISECYVKKCDLLILSQYSIDAAVDGKNDGKHWENGEKFYLCDVCCVAMHVAVSWKYIGKKGHFHKSINKTET